MKTNYKKPNYLIFGSTLLFLLLLVNLATLVIVALIFYKQLPVFGVDGGGKLKNPAANNAFAGCQLLSDGCITQDCQFYYLCGDFPAANNCTVYDCGGNYGITAAMADGSFATKEYAKPDKEKIYALVDRCQGKLTVKDKKCVSGKYEINLEVTTKGECLIQGFMVDTGNKNYIAPEFKPNSGGYRLTLNSCADYSEIIAVGEGGVSIR